MSSTENKAIIRRYIEEVWGKGDFAAEQELVAANIVDHNAIPGFPPGFAGHHQTVVMLRNAFPDGTNTLEDVIVDGDKVADRHTFRGTHTGEFMGIPPTGKVVVFSGMEITRIANGQIVEQWHQEDFLGIMQQLGVIPTAGQ
jgi:predicted ester cyclase